jgi:ketosteroid isomerase-like protein
MTPIDIARRFVDRINAKDIEGLIGLTSEDHQFVDSTGARYAGRDRMREGWGQYFRMVPDYRVEIHETFCEGQTVILVGVARGTYTADGKLKAENDWEIPVAWRAHIRGDLVASWQVYEDNEPIRRRMAEHTGPQPSQADTKPRAVNGRGSDETR